jgi:hypothetical protein
LRQLTSGCGFVSPSGSSTLTSSHHEHDLSGKFLYEIDAAATYYRNDGAEGYSRLVLPLWGDGRIGMLLAA